MRRVVCTTLSLWIMGTGIALAAEPIPTTPVAFRTQQLSDQFLCEGASAGDLNRDGHTDVVSGPYWYEGPNFEKRHEYYPVITYDPLKYSKHFFTYVDDVNGDSWNDVVVIGFPGEETWWFQNPAKADAPGHWPRHVIMKQTDNESPTYEDITGDGKREVVCSVGGVFGYASPAPGSDPTKPWAWHPISEKITGAKFTHGMGVGDVNGDGRMDLLHKGGWLEQPASLDGDPVWKHHEVTFSPRGGAQMYAYDIDGDGDNDVITSLQAHGYGLNWYEQKRDGGKVTWDSHMILGNTAEDNPYGVVFAQLHAIDLADIDGDGLKDIVTGKRWWAHGPKGDAEPSAPAVIYWFRLTREGGKVTFVPHLIDDNSGVGTQIVVTEINGDKLPDIVMGNKKGTFIHIQERKQISAR